MIAERNLILPVSKFIPASGAMDSNIESTEASGASSKNQSHRLPLVISNDKLFSESSLVRGIENIRMEQGGIVFTAPDADPYFHLPQVPSMPDGATVAIELTLPAERLVQLFYQTIGKPDFTEENSVTKILPAGRHRVEWPIKASLNGTFRLDPGNGPGEYVIHKIEIHP